MFMVEVTFLEFRYGSSPLLPVILALAVILTLAAALTAAVAATIRRLTAEIGNTLL